MASVAKSSRKTSPTTAYARRVVNGKIVSGRLVRLACERHLRDLKEGPARGLKFDAEAADHALRFFGYLNLPEGDRPFVLAPWQQFIIGCLFGWKDADTSRRFRTAYIEAGKGSGKSPMAAGVGLYGLVADGELAAEVYSAAVTREQASIMFRDAKRMAESSPRLAKLLEISEYNIAFPRTGSYMRAVSSEHRGLDGKRTHIALVDEIHEHPTSLVVDKMRANTKGRRQAMIFEITNSGHDRTSVCWRHRDYSEKILAGILQDDSWFAYVCTLDPCKKCAAEGKTQPGEGCQQCDDWRDEAVWLKAVPNLDVSVTRKYLREQVREAMGMPGKENIVKRLNFCIWTEQAERVIPMDKWDACARTIDVEALKGRLCYGGLDIGATSDFTAFALVFPGDDPETIEIPSDPFVPDGPVLRFVRRSFTLLSWFWLPGHPLRRDARMEETIARWRREGLVRTTPGDTVDYDQVLADICTISKPFGLAGIAFDRGFQGCQMGTNLQKHFGQEFAEAVVQGILSMAAPFRELLELVKAGRLYHDGHPVLRWMASNTAAEIRGGLMKPSKDKSGEKIDGITAATMALMKAIVAPAPKVSVYETRGVLRVGDDWR